MTSPMAFSELRPGCVILLDLLKQKSALVFQDPEEIISCTRLEDVPACLDRLEEVQKSGRYAAGFLAYELGFAFEDKLRTRFVADGEPLIWFGVYREGTTLALDQALALLAHETADPATLYAPVFDMDRNAYDAAFAGVQDHLARGNAYQVNLTMRARFRHSGSSEQVFRDLLRRQPVEFASYLKLEDRAVLSLSPELFLERNGETLRTRPMKGTAPRGRFASEDNRIAHDLAADPKQRAENTMIVDLMRNDLSRIAETGSVQVTRLCEVERYQSVHQMTSTIEARVHKRVGFREIVRNLFPCGSITGAPKLSAMQIAADLETGPRGIYTGSIGYLAPSGDFRFNVAIRTLVLRNDGTGEAGTGSGVVFDSAAKSEYEECALKLKFMTANEPEFDLIETMAYDRASGFLLLDRHMLRLKTSAEYFGFQFDECGLRAELDRVAAEYTGARRVRVLLAGDGATSISSTDLTPVDSTTLFNVVTAAETTHSADRWLYHKTTNRHFYDDTRQRYQTETGCQEVLFCNEQGYLTEGSYTTVFLKMGKDLVTPALHHGLLPGTFRAGLLERGLAVEADLTAEDLKRADAVFVGNSVRGLVKARMIPQGATTSESLQDEDLPLQVSQRSG